MPVDANDEAGACKTRLSLATVRRTIASLKKIRALTWEETPGRRLIYTIHGDETDDLVPE